MDTADEVVVHRDEDSRKDEIVEALEQHLNTNATRLSRRAEFEGFYRSFKSPVKGRLSTAAGAATSDDSGETKSIVRRRARPATKVKEEELP